MQPRASRVPWIDYLRGFITVLVVAHHSSLAYTSFAHFNKEAYILSTHPIVDNARCRGLDFFEDFNDIFFMSLMFLISGIFVMHSLQNKGIRLFIRDRFYRLFIPFIIGVTLLMLLAYYPSYYLAHGKNDIKDYITDFFTVEAWPVGPPWFIWVLFLFNLIIACCYPFIGRFITRAGKCLAAQHRRWLGILCFWYLITWLLYVPPALWAGPYSWTGIGPFDFQISRMLLYFGYFFIGILIGAPGLHRGILGDESAFAKKWSFWLPACICVYITVKLIESPLTGMINRNELNRQQATLIYRSIWALSCTFSCIAFLSLFKKIFRQAKTVWHSLAMHAYGIYLVHYIFVIWCQYLLLPVNLPALIKFSITFITSLTLSWVATYFIRKNRIAGKYL